MNKEEYCKWTEENDTYSKHSHQWIIRTYTDAGEYNPNMVFYRNFGPFKSQTEAVRFIKEYMIKYTTEGFITMWSVEELCEVIVDT